MPVAIACPKCKTKYKLPDSAMGKQLKCKSCGAVFKTKAPESANTIANTIEMDNSPTAAPQPSLQELAELGIGDLKQAGDVFAGAAMPPGQMSLGSVVDDPGFADFDLAREEAAEEKDDGMSAVLNNPYMSPGGGKQLKKNKGPRKPFVNDTPYSYKPLTLHACFVSIAAVFGVITSVLPASRLPLAGTEVGFNFWMIAALVVILFLYVPIVVFTYRANANARSLGAQELTISPLWCALGWLIPIISLVLPYIAMSEIARAARKPRGKTWQTISTPALVIVWWCCLISIVVISIIYGALARGEIIVIDERVASITNWSMIALGSAFRILSIPIVWGIAKRQAETASKAGVA